MFAGNLNKAMEPFRAKRAEIAAQPDLVPAVLADGARRARAIAKMTMAEVRSAVRLPRQSPFVFCFFRPSMRALIQRVKTER